METRVLTLFDDEDFYPKEEPKKKPKKEPVAKVIESLSIAPQPEIQETEFSGEMIEQQEDTTPASDVQEPELGNVIVKQEQHIAQSLEIDHVTLNSGTEIISAEEPAEQVGMDTPNAIIDEPKNKLPEEEGQIENNTAHVEGVAEELIKDNSIEPLVVAPDQTIVSEEPLSEIEDNEEPETNADDEELNKQILSELVQVDYTSLIHRDYPFDMSNASVVGKNAVSPSKEQILQDESNEEEEDNEVFEDIVPLPEWKLDKKYYTIGEVAQLFAVNTSHIRFWTNEFKLKPRTTRKGDRLYSPKDIAELRLIHHLVKEKKHTIKGAREKLKAEKNDVHKKLDLKDSLINLRDTLLKIKEQL
jgi:DNA-binding transcriptional MerR regulator